ncbi:MAG: methyl-accepting chemotaxis protein, partial [Janthinobacterium lividum]
MPQANEAAKRQLTIRQRILIGFGGILILMAGMAVITYTRLAAIESDANSVATDSIPGLYSAVLLRTLWSESYVVTQRLVYVDETPEAVKRDRDRLTESHRSLQSAMQDYEKTV